MDEHGADALTEPYGPAVGPGVYDLYPGESVAPKHGEQRIPRQGLAVGQRQPKRGRSGSESAGRVDPSTSPACPRRSALGLIR